MCARLIIIHANTAHAVEIISYTAPSSHFPFGQDKRLWVSIQGTVFACLTQECRLASVYYCRFHLWPA